MVPPSLSRGLHGPAGLTQPSGQVFQAWLPKPLPSAIIHSMLNLKGNGMTNQDLTKALVASIQNRQLARGYTMQDANAYTVGYLESLIGTLVQLSPKVKKEVMSTLVFVTNNKE